MSLQMNAKQPQCTSTLTILRFHWTTYQNSLPINFLATELLTLRLPTKLSFSTLLLQASFSQTISHNPSKLFYYWSASPFKYIVLNSQIEFIFTYKLNITEGGTIKKNHTFDAVTKLSNVSISYEKVNT